MVDLALSGSIDGEASVASRAHVLRRLRLADAIFRNVTRAAAIGVLVLLGSVIIALFDGALPAFREFGLDFISLAAEQYYLICHQDTLQRPAVQSILQLLSSDAFKRAIIAIPGYAAPRSGEVSSSRDVYAQGLG